MDQPFRFSDWHWWTWAYHIGDRAAYFSNQNCDYWHLLVPLQKVLWESLLQSQKCIITYQFIVQKWSVADSGSAFPVKMPHFETIFESHQGGKKSSCHASGNSADSKKKKGNHGTWCSWWAAVFYFIDIIIISCAYWYSLFLDQWKETTSNWLCLIMLRVTVFNFDTMLCYFLIWSGLTLRLL